MNNTTTNTTATITLNVMDSSNNNNQLCLKKFVPHDACDVGVVAVVGARITGKTTFVCDLFIHKQYLPGGHVFTASDEEREAFERRLDNAFDSIEYHGARTVDLPPYDGSISKLESMEEPEPQGSRVEEKGRIEKVRGVEYNEDNCVEALRTIYDEQGTKLTTYKRSEAERARAKEARGDARMTDAELEKLDFWAVWERDPRVFITIDETILYKRELFEYSVVRELFQNARYRKILLIVTTHSVMVLPPALRQNVDYWVLFEDHSRENRGCLFRCTAESKCGSPAVFYTIMDKCTKNYGCVVIDARCNTNNITDAIYWYSAALPASHSTAVANVQSAADFDAEAHFAQPSTLLLVGERTALFLLSNTVAMKNLFDRHDRVASSDYHEALDQLNNAYAAARAAYEEDKKTTTVFYIARTVNKRLFSTGTYSDLIRNGRRFGVSVVQQARTLAEAPSDQFDTVVHTDKNEAAEAGVVAEEAAAGTEGEPSLQPNCTTGLWGALCGLSEWFY